jgi:hypothetical protein
LDGLEETAHATFNLRCFSKIVANQRSGLTYSSDLLATAVALGVCNGELKVIREVLVVLECELVE